MIKLITITCALMGLCLGLASCAFDKLSIERGEIRVPAFSEPVVEP